MHIHFKTEGGLAYFPGLNAPVTLDSSQLPAAEAKELEQRVADACFFDLPAAVGAASAGAADYRQYTITIKDGMREHTVKLIEPIADTNVQELLTCLKGKTRAA